MEKIRFLDEQGTFSLAQPENYSNLYFPAANELGLRIPEDLSLVCFDAPDDGLTYHEYTHIRQAELEIGERAVRMLLDVIRGDREPKYLLVPTELCIGNSTASPSR